MKNMEIRRERLTTPVPTGMPWLVFPCGENGEHHTFCTISSSPSNTISTIVELQNIPELHKAEIRACYHGWLLFTTKDDDHSWNFWNPTTYESVKLPPIDKKMVKPCIFTASPQNPECKVLLLYYHEPTISYCQPGDQEWVTYNYRKKILEIDSNELFEDEDMDRDSLYNLACLDGVIYAWTRFSHLVSIELNNQTGLILKSMGPERPKGKFSGRVMPFFFESFGEIFIVRIFINWNTVFGIQVFRWNLSQKFWLPVENMDDRLIFLGSQRNSTSCLVAETGVTGNQIYFTMPNNELLYRYDLEEKTILPLIACPKLQTPWYQPFWMMPENPELLNLSQDEISKAVEKDTESVSESQRDSDACTDQYPPILNLDILTAIAKHLEPLDYLKFRAISKLFCSAAPPIKWSITSITSAMESPWLVTFSYNENVFSFTDPKYNNTYQMKVPESLLGTHIDSSKDGHLVMADGLNYFYFNPFNGNYVKCPSLNCTGGRSSFSCSPSSPDCQAVRIHVLDTGEFTIQSYLDFILPGYNSWVGESLGYVDGSFENGAGVFHRQMFYYLGRKGNLGVLKDDDTEGFSFKVLEKPEVPVTAYHYNYLMECNEELMAVFVGRNGNWVKVFRLDHSEMRWVRVRNLGNYTVFVSYISSFAAVTRSRGMDNKIYFPRVYNGSLVYYSLETEKFHTDGNNAVLNNFAGTKEQLYCTWIEPNCVDSKEQLSLNWSFEEVEPELELDNN